MQPGIALFDVPVRKATLNCSVWASIIRSQVEGRLSLSPLVIPSGGVADKHEIPRLKMSPHQPFES